MATNSTAAGLNNVVLLILITCVLLASDDHLLHHKSHLSAEAQSDLVPGLSFTFYNSSCPNLEKIVRDQLAVVFRNDISQAAGLLRLYFHDCMVQGCDASVLLDGSASGPSEKSAIPNLSLKAEAFTILNDLRDLAQNACGRVVSCADITALAARDSVFLSGGPDYRVPLGRRDGTTFATADDTLNNLFPPFANVSFLMDGMSAKNFTVTDLVTLSGAHTIGRGHCASFTDRLFPNQDPTLNLTFATDLKVTCPTTNSTNTAFNDIRSPNAFDNNYYVDLMNRQGLFTSDQDLFTDERTRSIVISYAENQTLFFERFGLAMIKVSQLGVLTGSQGEIRANCSARNPAAATSSSFLSSSLSSSSVQEDGENSAAF